MTIADAILLVVSTAAFVYLVVAMVRPEWF
ncbi:MAG TPA: potassium-transporting ATPase subunit F [Candidatus Micrarchaeia archaeon]|nr:potassium-transporting ATPase subunit F [Candidatus Micrarchaeia archaeon]